MPDNYVLDSLESPMYSSTKLPYKYAFSLSYNDISSSFPLLSTAFCCDIRKKRSRLGCTTPKLVPDLGDLRSLLLAASESATANAGILALPFCIPLKSLEN